ncbi:MAG: hypothetical protein NT121_07015 [Chloroflexi bacterium]|nr:hypothetical protein [Chloroflexota bacterium]
MQSIQQKPQKKTAKTGTPVYSSDGRVIGYVSGGTFYKNISFEKHLFKHPPAIMFDVSSLKDAEYLKAWRVEVQDRDSRDVYTAPIALIWEKPIYRNYGYGPQVGLALREWIRNGEPPASMPSKAAKPAPDATQSRLF